MKPSPKVPRRRLRPCIPERIPQAAAREPLVLLRRGNVRPPGGGSAEVNEQCIEMLVHAARHERETFALITELRDLLALSTPLMRRSMAARAFLLVDMHFRDVAWWEALRRRPSEPRPQAPWRGSFPRLAATQLVRSTLILIWNGVHRDPAEACVLFGMLPGVADAMSRLTLGEIDLISQKQWKHIHPRWDDRPGIWRKLLRAAEADEEAPMRNFSLHALQLLTGDLLNAAPESQKT